MSDKYKIINGVALAFVGDAYYDLQIRTYLIEKGFTSPKILHNKATNYVSAEAQYKILNTILEKEILNDIEVGVVKRARNSKSRNHKKVDNKTYNYSTAFEGLIGYLYLGGFIDRLSEIIALSIEIVESESNA